MLQQLFRKKSSFFCAVFPKANFPRNSVECPSKPKPQIRPHRMRQSNYQNSAEQHSLRMNAKVETFSFSLNWSVAGPKTQLTVPYSWKISGNPIHNPLPITNSKQYLVSLSLSSGVVCLRWLAQKHRVLELLEQQDFMVPLVLCVLTRLI